MRSLLRFIRIMGLNAWASCQPASIQYQPFSDKIVLYFFLQKYASHLEALKEYLELSSPSIEGNL